MSNINTIILVVASVVLLSLASIVAYGINKQNKEQKPKTPTFADPSAVAKKVQQQVSNEPVSKEMSAQFNMPQLKTPTSQQINNMFDKQIATLRAPKKQKPATDNIETKVYTAMKGHKSSDPSQQPKTNNNITLPLVQGTQTADAEQTDRTIYHHYDSTTGQLTEQLSNGPNANVPTTFELDYTGNGPVTITGIKYDDNHNPPTQKTMTIEDILKQNNSDLLRATFSKIVQDKQLANKTLVIDADATSGVTYNIRIPNDATWQNNFINAMKYQTNKTFMFPTNDKKKTVCFTPDAANTDERTILLVKDTAQHTITDRQNHAPNITTSNFSDDAKATIITSKFCKDNAGKLYYGTTAFDDNTYISLLNGNDITYQQFSRDIIFLIKHSQSPQVKECLEDIKRQMCKGIDVSKGATNSIHLIEKDDATPPMQMIVCIQTDTEGHKTIKRIYDFTNNITFDFNKKNHFFQNSAFKIDRGATGVGLAQRKITKEEAAIIVDALGTNYKHAERDGHQKWQKKKLRVGGGQPTESKVWTALRNFYPEKGKSVFTFETLVPGAHTPIPDRYMTTFQTAKNSADINFDNFQQITENMVKDNTAKVSTYSYFHYFKKTKDIINGMQPGQKLASLDFHEIPKYQTFSF